MKRIRQSGSQQRKKQKARHLELESLAGSMLKFIAPSTSSTQEVIISDEQKREIETSLEDQCQLDKTLGETETGKFIHVYEGTNSENIEEIVRGDIEDEESQKSLDEENEVVREFTVDPSYTDIGDWPLPVPDKLRIDLIKKGSVVYQNKDGPFCSIQRPSNTLKVKGITRQLSTDWFYKNLPNGEKILRTWMAYSPKKESLFCVCCKLFTDNAKKGKTSKFISGFQSWWKLSPKVANHENSDHHLTCLEKWKTLIASLNAKKTIDQISQAVQEKERQKWKNILYRLLDVTLFLAKQNLPFRGHRENELSENKGNFLELIQFMSKYDPILKEHIIGIEREASQSRKVLASYLSPSTQNEFITLLGDCVKEKILSDIKKATYYGILFDSTPDVSHIEQMCEVIRYVHIESGKVEVRESFLSYFQLTGKKAVDITEDILKILEKDGLDIKMCRSQGYDNASAMAGVHSGVQARIKEINPKALFVPCANHSLNLCGVHAFGTVASCVTFFGTLESIYAFFSASTHRWEILIKHIGITVKRLSETRWSAQHDAIKPVFSKFSKFIETLETLSDTNETVETRGAAQNLSIAICDFSFLCYLSLWSQVLEEINHTQKYLQIRGVSFEKCVIKMKSLKIFLNENRYIIVENALQYAKATCEELDIPLEKRRVVKIKKPLPGENAKDERLTLVEELKRAMLECIDRFYHEITTRSSGMEQINSNFAILQTQNILEAPETELQKLNLVLKTTFDEFSVEDADLPKEILRFRRYLEAAGIEKEQAKEWTCLKCLEFIVEFDFSDSLPILSLALRFYLTICVSVASCERSFSKLKLIKSYLRSTMSQARLSSLAILSIENAVAKNIDFDHVISMFAKQKARKRI